MKRLFVYLAVLVLASTVGLVTLGLSTLPLNTVLLPIEVVGPDNHTESVAVSASDVSGVDRVWFLGYSVAHPQHFLDSEPGRYSEPKAEVRLNSGPWVGITNDNVRCNDPEESTFNCVQGPYHTTRFSISTDRLGTPVRGQNTLEFRFNYAPGDPSSGYYILGVSFLRAGDAAPSYTTWANAGAIDGTTWTHDDPAGWTPPSGFNTASDIEAGRSLWEQRDRLLDHPGGPQITASCADCHAAKGEDLEYFSFSNKSIISRSEFHGLSAEEGKQIAAYIRSQAAPRVSWPWQPPYQPGPEVASPDPECQGQHPDEAPQKCWGAGAGLAWVLEEDTETAEHLFPNGVAGAEGLDVASTQSTLNLREVPIGLMYPDWNDWLPRTHPLDSDAFGAAFRASEFWNAYESGRLHDAKNDPQALHGALSGWYEDRYLFGGQVIDDQQDPLDEKMGYRQWAVVKLWEIMRGVEDYAPQVYEHGEARSWIGPDSTPFDVAPHIHEGRVYGPERTLHDSYLDTAWYDLAMVLNAGNRGGEHVLFPIDWRYHLGHIKGMGRAARPEPLRFARSYLKQNQVLDLGDAPAATSDQGLSDWFWRYTTHFQMFDSIAPETDKTPIAFAPEPLKTDLYTTLFRAYMQRVLRVPTGDWRRGDAEAALAPESHVPDPDQTVIGVTDYAEHFYRGLPWLRDRGVRSSLIDSAATWAATMWPKGNDPAVMGDSPTWDEMNPCIGANIPADCSAERGGRGGSDLTVSLSTPSAGASFAAPARITLRADASSSDGVDRVVFYSGSTQLATLTSAPYEYTWANVPAGTYTVTATATDTDGATASASASVTVNEPPNEPPTVQLTAPSGDATRTAPAAIDLAAEATDPDGSVQDVTFTAGADTLATLTSAPYAFTWEGVPAGTHTVTATATDTNGATASASASVTVNEPVPTETGVAYSYYEQGWQRLPDFDAFTPVATGTAGTFTLAPSQREDQFGFQFTAYVRIPEREAGDYTFYTRSDDGSKLYVNGTLVVDNGGLHETRERSGTVALTAGWHQVVVEYFELGGGQALTVAWASSAFAKEEIPSDRLFPAPAPEVTQTIHLQAGWNTMSSRVLPTDPSLDGLFGDLDGLVMVKDAAGNTYVPAEGVDDIGSINTGSAYQVYMEEPQTMTISGARMDHTTRLDLEGGWNLVAFYPDVAMEPQAAFIDLQDALVMVKDESGNAYIPELGVNDIGTLQPGEGYQVFVRDAVTFAYPASDALDASAAKASQP